MPACPNCRNDNRAWEAQCPRCGQWLEVDRSQLIRPPKERWRTPDPGSLKWWVKRGGVAAAVLVAVVTLFLVVTMSDEMPAASAASVDETEAQSEDAPATPSALDMVEVPAENIQVVR